MALPRDSIPQTNSQDESNPIRKDSCIIEEETNSYHEKSLVRILLSKKTRIGMGTVLILGLIAFVIVALSNASSSQNANDKALIGITSSPTTEATTSTFTGIRYSFEFEEGQYNASSEFHAYLNVSFSSLLAEVLHQNSTRYQESSTKISNIREGSIIIETILTIPVSDSVFMQPIYILQIFQESIGKTLRNTSGCTFGELCAVLGSTMTISYIVAYTQEPTFLDTQRPSDLIGITPSTLPIFQPALAPTEKPNEVISNETAEEVQYPTRSPSLNPAQYYTYGPTTEPTVQEVTQIPTKLPSNSRPPLQQPTGAPTNFPSTGLPTNFPSSMPTLSPTKKPTRFPTTSPVSSSPTLFPSAPPTSTPTHIPTSSPTKSPATSEPTRFPSFSPTARLTQQPTNIPTTSPLTQYPTQFPTETDRPTTSTPTMFPTLSPSLRPTTGSPTSFPTPDPIHMLKSGDISCEAFGQVYDLTVFNILLDNNLGDVEFDTEGYLKPMFNQHIKKILKHEAMNFRAAHPSNSLSQLGLLFGKYPNQGTLTMTESASYRINLYSILQECGYKVSHFGLWHNSRALLDDLNLHHTYISNDPLTLTQNIRDYLLSIPVDVLQDNKEIIFIWWPRADLYNDIGGRFLDSFDPISNYIDGVSGISNRFGDVCKDVIREDESFFRFLFDSDQRYDICSRQLHIVNEKLGLQFIAEIVSLLKDMSKGPINTFLALTSSNGPERYSQDPTQETKSSYRGSKDTLYEGGIRVPFFFNAYINRDNEKYQEYNFDELKSLEIPNSLNAVDLLPTILSWSGVTLNSILENHFDGEDIFNYLKESTLVSVPRRIPQLYQNLERQVDSCISDSPQLAIVDNYGKYKLLVEPPADMSNLPDSVTDLELAELYDLSHSNYESTNWIKSKPQNSRFSENLELVTTTLYEKLRTNLKYLNFQVMHQNNEPGCKNLFNINNRKKSSVSTSSNINKNLKGIIVILTDDMGHADASIYGKVEKNERSRNRSFFMSHTPNIDRIAENGGFVFSDFYSNSAVCSPSRAALLTSKYPSHVFNRFHSAVPQDERLVDRKGVVSFLGEGSEKEHFNMYNFFKSQGYVTGHFGKWHLGFNGKTVDDPIYGLDQYQIYAGKGFDSNKKRCNFPTSRNASKYYDTEFDNTELLFPSKSSKIITERTMEFIKERILYDEKFVVNVWLQSAHAPLNLDTKHDQVARYNYTLAKNQETSMKKSTFKGKLETGLEVYRTLLSSQDTAIGKLLDFLEKNSLMDNTAIFYSSDNGAETVDKYFHAVGNTFSHFRGYKRSLYEGGIRVPGLMRFGREQAEYPTTVITHPATLMDVFPTAVGLAGLTTELQRALADKASQNPSYKTETFSLQGNDLSCILLGTDCASENPELKSRPHIFEWRETNSGGDCLGWSARFALRYNEYKLHLEPKDKTRRILRRNKNLDTEYTRIELYDVVLDPAELTNLWITQRSNSTVVSIVEDLVSKLVEYTQQEAYDTSLFPSNRAENKDYSTGRFPIGHLCVPNMVTGVKSSMPWISTAYLKDFI